MSKETACCRQAVFLWYKKVIRFCNEKGADGI